MESELEQTKANVASLRRLLESPAKTAHARVEFRSQASAHGLAIVERVRVDDLDAWWVDAFGELHSAAARARVERAGPDGALYPGEWFHDEVGDVTAFVPVATARQARGSGRVQPFVVPAAELASALRTEVAWPIFRTAGRS